jgi:hypothetical protein
MPAVRVAVVVLAIVLLHLIERIHWLYFVILGAAAAGMFLHRQLDLPGLGFLTALARRDRLAVWIVLFCLALIGYLHTANQWVVDGPLLRPAQSGLWKTEMVLVIALAAPLAHWAASLFTTLMARVDGRRFATEFALYVNFSGIALALWTDDAAVSRNALAALIVLVVLTELTLYASLDDG